MTAYIPNHSISFPDSPIKVCRSPSGRTYMCQKGGRRAPFAIARYGRADRAAVQGTTAGGVRSYGRYIKIDSLVMLHHLSVCFCKSEGPRYICIRSFHLRIGLSAPRQETRCRKNNTARKDRSQNPLPQSGSPNPRHQKSQHLIHKRRNHHSHGRIGNGVQRGISIIGPGRMTMVLFPPIQYHKCNSLFKRGVTDEQSDR
jgi:hypothetical protein